MVRAVKHKDGWYAYSDDGLDKIAGPETLRSDAVEAGVEAVAQGRMGRRSPIALPPKRSGVRTRSTTKAVKKTKRPRR